MTEPPALDSVLRQMVLERTRYKNQNFASAYTMIASQLRGGGTIVVGKVLDPCRLPTVPLAGLMLVPNAAVGGVNVGGIDRKLFAQGLLQHVEDDTKRAELVALFLDHLKLLDVGDHLRDPLICIDSENGHTKNCAYALYQEELSKKQLEQLVTESEQLLESGPLLDGDLTDTDSDEIGSSDDELDEVNEAIEELEQTIVADLNQTETDLPKAIEVEVIHPPLMSSDVVIADTVVVSTTKDDLRPYRRQNAFELRLKAASAFATDAMVVDSSKPMDMPNAQSPQSLVRHDPNTTRAIHGLGPYSDKDPPEWDGGTDALVFDRRFADEQAVAPFAGIYIERMPRSMLTPARLARLAILLSQPNLLSKIQAVNIVRWVLKHGEEHHIRLFVSSPLAVRFLRKHPELETLKRFVVFPPDGKLSEQEQAVLLRMRAEALYLAWLVFGCLPTNIWDALLLMYACQRAYHAAQRQIFADSGTLLPSASVPGNQISRSRGRQSFMDSVRQGLQNAQSYLQEKYQQYVTPTLERLAATLTREKIDAAGRMLREGFARLKEYGSKVYDSASGYANQIYDGASVYARQAAQKVREFSQKVADKARNLSAEDFAAKLLRAREWLKEKANAVAQYIRENPTFQKILASMSQFVDEAKAKGVSIYEYMKTKAPEVQEYFAQKMSQLDELMTEAGVKIKNWIKTKIPVEAEVALERQFDNEQSKQEERITEEPDFDMGISPDDPREIRNVQARLNAERRRRQVEFEAAERERQRREEPPKTMQEQVQEQVKEEQAQEVMDALNEQPPNAEADGPINPPRPTGWLPVIGDVSTSRYSDIPEEYKTTKTRPLPIPPPIPPRDDWIASTKTDEYTEPAPPVFVGEDSYQRFAESDKEEILEDLNKNLAGMSYWLARVPNTEFYNPELVSGTIAQIERFFWESRDEEMKQHTYDNNTYRVLAGYPTTETDIVARNTLIQRIVRDIETILREAIYGRASYQSASGPSPTAVADAIDYLLQDGTISQYQVDDVYALVRLMNKQDLAIASMRGPFDATRALGSAPVARDLYERTASFEPIGDFDEMQKRHGAHSLLQLLQDPNGHFRRAVIFDDIKMTPMALVSSSALHHARNALVLCSSTDGSSPKNVMNAFSDMRFNLPSDKGEYDRVQRMRATGNFMSWMHSLGALLSRTTSISAEDMRLVDGWKSLGDKQTLETWESVVYPTFQKLLSQYNSQSLDQTEPFSLAQLNDAFTSVIDAQQDPYASAARLRRFMDLVGTTDGGMAKWGTRQLHADLLRHRLRQYLNNVRIDEAMRSSDTSEATVSAISQMKHDARWLWLEIQKYGLADDPNTRNILETLRKDGKHAHLLTLFNIDKWLASMHFQIDFALGLSNHHVENKHLYFRDSNDTLVENTENTVNGTYQTWDPSRVLTAVEKNNKKREPVVIMRSHDANHPTPVQTFLMHKHVADSDSYLDVLRGFETNSVHFYV